MLFHPISVPRSLALPLSLFCACFRSFVRSLSSCFPPPVSSLHTLCKPTPVTCTLWSLLLLSAVPRSASVSPSSSWCCQAPLACTLRLASQRIVVCCLSLGPSLFSPSPPPLLCSASLSLSACLSSPPSRFVPSSVHSYNHAPTHLHPLFSSIVKVGLAFSLLLCLFLLPVCSCTTSTHLSARHTPPLFMKPKVSPYQLPDHFLAVAGLGAEGTLLHPPPDFLLFYFGGLMSPPAGLAWEIFFCLPSPPPLWGPMRFLEEDGHSGPAWGGGGICKSMTCGKCGVHFPCLWHPHIDSLAALLRVPFPLPVPVFAPFPFSTNHSISSSPSFHPGMAWSCVPLSCLVPLSLPLCRSSRPSPLSSLHLFCLGAPSLSLSLSLSLTLATPSILLWVDSSCHSCQCVVTLTCHCSHFSSPVPLSVPCCRAPTSSSSRNSLLLLLW